MKQKSSTRYLLPLLAAFGIGFGLIFAIKQQASMAPREVMQKRLPATSSFEDSISGSGLIEANTRNIEIGSSLSGIVTELLVTEGQQVKAGQPLFKLDDRSAKSDVMTQENDMRMVAAQLEEAKVNLADQDDQVKRINSMKVGLAVTVDRVRRAEFAQLQAKARLEVTKASLDAAKARVEAAKTTLDKLTVTAPVEGRIFKINVRPGEFVQAGPSSSPPIVMGNDRPLYVRVTIDENDIWRLREDAKVNGALRSNRDIKFPLTFVRIEPYVVPKKSLTGSMSERVDTRVLEVIYSIDSPDVPVYIGQQVDVFVDAHRPDGEAAPKPAPKEEDD